MENSIPPHSLSMSRDILKVERAYAFLEHHKVHVNSLEVVRCVMSQNLADRRPIISRAAVCPGLYPFDGAEDDKVVAQSREELELFALFFLEDVFECEWM